MLADFDPDGFSVDALLGGRLTLRQPKRGHRAGHDAILLAAATPARRGERIADLGAGAGQAGLALAARAKAIGVGPFDLLMVERDASLTALAADNAVRNSIAAQAVMLDLGSSGASFAAAGIAADSVDRVLMNPPFNDAARHRASADPGRQAAHLAEPDTLDIFLHAARRMLKPSGTLTLIWRADGLNEVLQELSRGFGGVAVQPVHPRPGENAIRILVGATKGARGPLVVRPGLVLNDDQGKPTREADAILRGDAAILLLEEA